MKEVFTEIYRTNYWRGESRSGKGSAMVTTAVIRDELPQLFAKYKVGRLLDAGCGDFFWGSRVQWPEHYIGADIVPELIGANRKRWPAFEWRVLDVTQDPLPKVHLVLARDIFGHFPYRLIDQALANIKRSGAKYLLATTFPGRPLYQDIKAGEWHPVNLEHPQFGLGNWIELINEQTMEGKGEFRDKSLGLWRLDGS